MTREEMLQDLAYARSLAEEGRHAPLLGGSYFVFWGVLNMVAYAAHWAMLEGYLPGGNGGLGFGVLWGSYGIVAGVGSALLGTRVRDKPGRSAIGVRAEHAIWRGVGLALIAIVLGCIGRMAVENDPLAPNAIMGPAFALFGAALIATCIMARERWLGGFGLVAIAVGLVLGLFANAIWAYALASAASLIVLVTPGLILLRREPAPID